METQGRSKSFKPKLKKGKNTVAKAMKAIKQVKRELQPESKMSNTTNYTAPVLIPSAGQIDDLTTIIQGDDFDQRTGNEVDVKNIQMRYVIKWIGAETPTPEPNNVRVIVFYWKDSSVPTVLDVLNVAHPLSALNQDKTDLIKIVYDNMYVLQQLYLGGAGTPASGFLSDNSACDKFYKKLNLRYKYNGSAADVPNKNQLYILYIADTTLTHTMAYYSRVRFADS